MPNARSLRLATIAPIAAFLAIAMLTSACAGGSGAAEAAAIPIPPNSNFAKIELNMGAEQVRSILGAPDNTNGYMTGKAFIPYYYGTDTARTDWLYVGQGRIVFSRNRYTGNLKVIKVLYNPADTTL